MDTWDALQSSWKKRDTPPDLIAKGRETLNSSLQHELDKLIATSNPNPSQGDIQGIKDRIGEAVRAAIVDSLSIWDRLLSAIGFKAQDDQVGTAIFHFSHSDLMASDPRGIPLENNLGG